MLTPRASASVGLVLAVLLTGFSGWISLANAPDTGAKPIAVTGRLEVLQEDDWDLGHGRLLHFVKELESGRVFALEGPATLLKGLRSGSTVVVQGITQGETILVGVDGVGGVEVIDVAAQASGPHSVVVLIVEFSDGAVACSDSEIEGKMFTGAQSVDLLYQETSFNLLSFPNDIDLDGEPDVFRVSIDASVEDACDQYGWAALADTAALDVSVDLGLYKHRLYVLPSSTSCGWAGLANVGCGTFCRVWVKSCGLEDVYAHELGHNLGLAHASTDLDNNNVVDCTYCDTSDFMGYGGAGWRQVNGPHKEFVGWMPEEQIVDVIQEGTQTFVLSPLEVDPALAPFPQLLKIARPSTEDYYYLSYRQQIGYDANLAQTYAAKTNIHRYAGSGYHVTMFIDALGDNESFEDLSLELNVTQVSHDETSVTVQVTFGPGCIDCEPCADYGADVDDDGVCGDVDNCPDQVNPGQEDSDGDGLGDVCDACPLDVGNDVDGDDVCGDVDNCIAVFNPDQADSDLDGTGDSCDPCPADAANDVDDDGVCGDVDNCPEQGNPGQEDSDGDGLGDVCDACPLDVGNDVDGDEVCGDADNCVAVFNPNQADSDLDGTGDSCDPCPADAANDVDGDGVCGDVDNCVAVFNPNQADSDLDGSGDSCDPCPTDATNDVDGDGFCGNVDNCPSTWNSDQQDSDADGLGDACDNCPTDPLNDSDNDDVCAGADNCPEVHNPAQGDRDGDGLGDLCDSFLVNFAPATSPEVEGYSKDTGAVFDPAKGHGWDWAVSNRERGTGEPKELDTFVFATGVRYWTTELPNGDYNLRVVSGDAVYPGGPHRVLAGGGVLLDDVVVDAAEFAESTVGVQVRGGRLDLTVGGSDGVTHLNLVEIMAAPGEPETLISLNFQPGESTTPTGYLAATGRVFDEGDGFGWDLEVATRDRGANLPQVDDTLVASFAPRLWEIEIANGFYDVFLVVGDAAYSSGPHSVTVEDLAAVDGIATVAGEFHRVSSLVHVDDGRLSVEIGGGGGPTALCQLVIATADSDADGDGVPIGEDNCPMLANPDQLDGDGDGFGDACDADDDDDGVEDAQDNCPALANPAQLDTDGDNLGDTCDTDDDGDGTEDDQDNCPVLANPAQGDTDGDDVGDLCDNCPSTGNSSQAASDGDGMGDACDPCPADALNDGDGDGLCADQDNCPAFANPAQEDQDGDGLGDFCDPLRITFTPAEARSVAGFVSDHGEVFNPSSGFGWDATLGTVDRQTGIPAEMDTFALSSEVRRWCSELPNGDYAVRVVSGDPSLAQGPHFVEVEDRMAIDGLTTEPMTFVENTVTLPIRDGQIDLTLGPAYHRPPPQGPGSSGGGSGNQALGLSIDETALPTSLDTNSSLINLVEIVRVPSETEVVASVSFQPETSSLAVGYVADSGEAFDPVRGLGWDQPVAVQERAANMPQTNDTFALSTSPRTWQMEIQNGLYEVFLVVGDPAFEQGPHFVLLEGTPLLDGVMTASGELLRERSLIQVGDGRLTVEIGGGVGTTTLCQIVVVTAPLDADGDGIANEIDNCPAVSNVDQTDDDGDGAGNACDSDVDQDGVDDSVDNCPGIGNPDQLDADSDGIGDACDPDDDADGVEDGIDNCPHTTNPTQADLDGDSIGDACDVCFGVSGVDGDGDGTCDEVDVCPGVSNTDQSDSDGDGMGDACDICPNDPQDDVDGDGLCADVDNCPELSNSGQSDGDGDGVGNQCDNCVSRYNPDQTDTDGDGKGDACDSH